KRMLKLALSGLLLTGGILAYADGEVTLTNGGKIVSWSDFVAAINDPSSVKGTLPAGADADLVAAKGAVTTAEGVVTEKKALVAEGSQLYTDSVEAAGTLAGYEKTLAEAEASLKTAREDSVKAETAKQTYLDGIVAAKKKAYDDAEAQLASWNTQMTELNNTLTQLTGESTALTGEIDDENQNLADLNKEYAALKTTTTTETKTEYPDWLANTYAKAQAYQTIWNEYLQNFVDKNDTVYYRITTGQHPAIPGIKTNNLTVAFVKPDVYETESDWKTAYTANQFLLVLYDASGNPVSFTTKNIYFGQNLKNLNNQSANSMESFSYTEPMQWIDGVMTKLNTLRQTQGNFKTTTTTNTEYDDPAEEARLKKEIEDKEKEISGLRSQRQTVNGNITTTRNSMTDIQKLIDGYTKVPTGAAEGTLSQQAQLKKAWDDAAAGNFDEADLDTDAYKKCEQDIKDCNTTIEGILKNVADANADIENAKSTVEEANAAIAAAREDVTTAEAGVVAAEQKVTEEEGKLEAAQKAANEAEQKKYYDITLNADVTADVAIQGAFNGTIWGEGHIINVTTETPFITGTFSGQLSNAAVNGNFARSTVGSTIDEVAVWNAGNGRYYNAAGVMSSYTDIAALGFETRTKYGISFANKGELVTLDENSKVYSINVYQHNGTNRQQYVLANDGAMTTSAGAYTLPVNTFAESATDDVKGLNLANVFYGVNHDCDLVKITDSQNFFCPVDIKAEAVEYGRQYKAGMNTVCLPFELDASYSSGIEAICTYDREADNAFWFTKVGDNIPANTPVLILGKQATQPFTLNIPSGTTIKKTEKQIVQTASTSDKDNSVCFGNLKRVAVGEFAGEYEAQMGNMYGLQGGDFHPAGIGATFPAFRMVIKRDTNAPAPANAPRRIRIVDEDGIEITEQLTGVNAVAAEATMLSVVGGQGEIIITSDADYGKVAVYSLDGKVVAMPEVLAGMTTNVNVQKGIYIVMGQKVLVK
ncbi:MAG: hypothetical protein K2L96_01965, partial [Muribaculaceae bacterium]|nr:hypothetical protein [Muribaculaceae bacterium]